MTDRRRRRSGTWAVWLATAAGLALAPGLAPAQVKAVKSIDPVKPVDANVGLTEAQVADQALAVCFARLATRVVRRIPEPQTGDFALIAMFLEEAVRLNPADDDMLRRLIEAYGAAGDEEGMLDATRRLVRLDPSDTVAQLRLISGQVQRLQSVDERLAAFDRFLGPAGESIDASVRSRLALDAALLCREQGDVDKFADYLAKASALDPTNKDAAALAVAFFTQAMDEPQGRLELLLNLLKADPLDPATHLAIARELAAAGAFKGAARFYNIWTTLLQVTQVEKDRSIPPEEFLIEWRLAGADRVVSKTWTAVEDRRSGLRAKREYEKGLGLAEDQLTDPDAETFTIQIARTITLAASAIDDIERTRWGLAELKRAAQRERDDRKKLTPPEEGPTPDVEGELLWARLWSGQEIDEAAADLEQWRALPGINPVALKRVEGWLALRRGEFDKAIKLLSELPPDDIFGPLGLALIDELKGSKQSAIEGYTRIANERPGTYPGTWAATRCERLAGKPIPPTATAETLEAMIFAIPMWLEEMTRDPGRFMSMHAEVIPSGRTAFDRLRIVVRLRNLMPIPMGVGPDGPINSRMLVTTPLEVAGQHIPAKDFIVVGLADRRLRLLPQESYDAVIPLDTGRLGEALLELIGYSVRVRFRVIQGFEAVVAGGQSTYQQGPLSAATTTDPYTRSMAMIARMEPVRVENAIRAGGPISAAEAVAGLNWRYLQKPAENELMPMSPEQEASLVKALEEKYPLVARTQRGLWLFTMPPTTEDSPYAPIEKVMRSESDPVLAAIVALSRSKNAEDPLLDELAARNDPWLNKALPLMRDYIKRRAAVPAAPAADSPDAGPGAATPTPSATPSSTPPTRAPAPSAPPSPAPAPAPAPTTPPTAPGGK